MPQINVTNVVFQLDTLEFEMRLTSTFFKMPHIMSYDELAGAEGVVWELQTLPAGSTTMGWVEVRFPGPSPLYGGVLRRLYSQDLASLAVERGWVMGFVSITKIHFAIAKNIINLMGFCMLYMLNGHHAFPSCVKMCLNLFNILKPNGIPQRKMAKTYSAFGYCIGTIEGCYI